MSARYIGPAETPEGAMVHRFEVYLDAAVVEQAAAEAVGRIAAGQSPPRTLAASAHAVAADILDAAVAAGLGGGA
jgi:hypothetical protein